MTKDRSADRHIKPARIIRPDPPELWGKLGAAVGTRQRSAVISEFIRWYLRLPGAKMPRRPDPSGEQGHPKA